MDDIAIILAAVLLVGILLFFMNSSSNKVVDAVKHIATLHPAPAPPTPAPEPSREVYYNYFWPKAWGYMHPNRRLYRTPGRLGPWTGKGKQHFGYSAPHHPPHG